jgi:hypothetical protein
MDVQQARDPAERQPHGQVLDRLVPQMLGDAVVGILEGKVLARDLSASRAAGAHIGHRQQMGTPHQRHVLDAHRMALAHMHHPSAPVALASHLRFHRPRGERESDFSFGLHRFLCGNKNLRVFRVPFPLLSSI